MFGKGNYHCGHVSLREVKLFKRILSETYVNRKRFRDLEAGEKCFVGRVGGEIVSCDECRRRYEEGTIIQKMFPVGL